jgi:hypothetical protein
MAEEIISFFASGSLPGIPGEHAPGTYLVDYAARTIRPAQDATSEEIPEEVQQGEIPTQEPAQENAMPDVVPVPDLQETPAQESINQ